MDGFAHTFPFADALALRFLYIEPADALPSWQIRRLLLKHAVLVAGYLEHHAGVEAL